MTRSTTQIRFDDAAVRIAAFRWLSSQVAMGDDVLPRQLLQQGFEFQGRRVPLLGPQGIFKPAALAELPLSITTAPEGPYDDSFDDKGFLRYRYRGTDPAHPENATLRKAMQLQIPLVHFHGVAKGRYLAVWPVFIVGDDPGSLTFTVAVDDVQTAEVAASLPDGLPREVQEASARRAYITATVRVRLHQRGFRERVFRAYRDQCALCRLRHRELLDAAHIVPDASPTGDPLVTNGLCLCKLHHAAFDRSIIGVRPDYVVEVHPRVLRERDGPMLRHGLQGLHHASIVVPSARRDRPDPDRLKERYKSFQSAA
jgi:putative restriction endonuclease